MTSKSVILKKIGLVCFFLLILIIAYLKTQNVSLPQINLDNIKYKEKEYILPAITSQSYYINYVSQYPQVKLSPAENQYFFSNIEETINLNEQRNDYLFFTSKRIAELDKWGGTIAIKKNVSNAKELQDWWQKTKPHFWEYYKRENFNSWEAILARYMASMDKQIEKGKYSLDKNTDKIDYFYKTASFINNHQTKVDQVIFALERSSEEKQYLKKLSDSVFSHLLNQISDRVDFYNLTRVEYPINYITESSDFGIYNAVLDTEIQPAYFDNKILISTPYTTYQPCPQEELCKEDAYINTSTKLLKVLIFPRVTVDKSVKSLYIDLPKTNFIAQEIWQEESLTNDTRHYMNIPGIEKKTRYLFRVNYKVSKPVTLLIQQGYDEIKDGKVQFNIETFINDQLLPDFKSKTYQRIVEFSNPRQNLYTRVIVSSAFIKELKQNITHIDPELYPIYEPNLTMEKITHISDRPPEVLIEKISPSNYLLTLKNLNKIEQYNVIKAAGFGWKGENVYKDSSMMYVKLTYPPASWTFFFLIILGPALLLLLFDYVRVINSANTESPVEDFFFSKTPHFLLFIFRQGLTIILYPIKLAWRFVLIVAINLRFLFLLAVLSVIFGQIFVIKDTYDLIIFIFVPLWILTLIGYRSDERISFVFALFFLVLTIFFKIVKETRIAENTAVWSYMFLFTGVLHTLLELKIQRKNIQQITEELKRYIGSRIISSIILFLRKMYYLSIRLIQLTIKAINICTHFIFDFNPKNVIDHLFNISKLMVVITVLTVIVIFSYQKIVQIRQEVEQRKQDFVRLSLNPLVTKVQPQLTYRSTKVIIYGKRFGWGESEKIFTTQNEEVRTDLWTDEKIVFTVPLHWPTGQMYFHIEKPAVWDGETVMAQSNVFSIKIIPTTQNFTPEDDLFFEQLKTLEPEVRIINGYK